MDSGESNQFIANQNRQSEVAESYCQAAKDRGDQDFLPDAIQVLDFGNRVHLSLSVCPINWPTDSFFAAFVPARKTDPTPSALKRSRDSRPGVRFVPQGRNKPNPRLCDPTPLAYRTWWQARSVLRARQISQVSVKLSVKLLRLSRKPVSSAQFRHPSPLFRVLPTFPPSTRPHTADN